MTLTQWTVANMRIMLELLHIKQLDRIPMFDYIAYTSEITELEDCYTWISVLSYHKAYRELHQRFGIYNWLFFIDPIIAYTNKTHLIKTDEDLEDFC